MAYTAYQEQEFGIRYSLTEAPSADVAGFVSHQLTVQVSADGQNWSDDVSLVVHVPATELETVLVMSNGAAKVAAYKDALRVNRNTAAVTPRGVTNDAVQQRQNELARAAAAASGAAEYIASVAGSYPVHFAI